MVEKEKTFEELLADMANFSAQVEDTEPSIAAVEPAVESTPEVFAPIGDESYSVLDNSLQVENVDTSNLDTVNDKMTSEQSSGFGFGPLPTLDALPALDTEVNEIIADGETAVSSNPTVHIEDKVDESALELTDVPAQVIEEIVIEKPSVEEEEKAPYEIKSEDRTPIYEEILPSMEEVLDRDDNVDKESTVLADSYRVENDELLDTPLEKPSDESADKVVVTPSGHTLEDMLLHLRGGNVKIDKELNDYKKGAKVVEVNGKKKQDNRYVKHAERIESDTKSAEGKKKSAKGFLQKNTRYTEEEKVIMRNLGLQPADLVKVMKKDNGLTERDKARIIAAGRAGDEKYFKGKRFRATVGDRDIIQFLAKFKFSNTRILSRLRAEPQSRTWRKLQRLKEGGIVADSEVIGLGTIWYLTEAGMAFSGYSFPSYRNTPGKTSQMPPIIGANHVAACLWNNEHNILFLEDFPANNRLIPKRGDLERVQGETLISETELRSSLGRETNPSFGGSRDGAGQGQYAMVSESAAAIWHEWNKEGRSKFSPEMEVGNEYLWVLFPRSGLTKSFHIPDLIVSRPRDEDGTPRSIAVEVELNQKSYERYMETLTAYKLDEDIYEKVVWITPNAAISRVLTEIAETIGLEGFDVVPMSNEDGLYKNPDIWHI